VASLFQLENVSFDSCGIRIISGVSLAIERGSITAFLGKSGSGKSTLLKLTAGLLQPTAGTVYYNGKNINTFNRTENAAYRKSCAFMFQDAALWANQNILQNLSLPLQIHYPEMEARSRLVKIQNICSAIGYTRPLTLRPADLSTGEQKQAGFARALICEPEVLFLDECTESLDRRSRETMCQILETFISKGHTIVYVSHENGFISRFRGTVYIVESGTIKKTKSALEADT
jgi:ABC-type lipoprotein export system ATPase subunit